MEISACAAEKLRFFALKTFLKMVCKWYNDIKMV